MFRALEVDKSKTNTQHVQATTPERNALRLGQPIRRETFMRNTRFLSAVTCHIRSSACEQKLGTRPRFSCDARKMLGACAKCIT